MAAGAFFGGGRYQMTPRGFVHNSPVWRSFTDSSALRTANVITHLRVRYAPNSLQPSPDLPDSNTPQLQRHFNEPA
jgi:hypothetical protein